MLIGVNMFVNKCKMNVKKNVKFLFLGFLSFIELYVFCKMLNFKGERIGEY